MCTISNCSRSISVGETSGEDGNSTNSFTGKDYYEDLIERANSVPLVSLFRYYNLRVNDVNRKIVCPFPTHKGGRETTPSFLFYPKTNTFFCFGCKIGTRTVDFVSAIEGISKTDAAYKIISLCDVSETFENERFDSSDKLELMIELANIIREFRDEYNDESSFKFIELICFNFDVINNKLREKLNAEALRSVVDQLKSKIESYKLRVK
jgi:DNA primase